MLINLLALRDYQVRVLDHAHELMHGLSLRSGREVNAMHWAYFYGFDVMGDLALGKSFDMLKTGEAHQAVKLLHDGMVAEGVLAPVIWMIPVLANIPRFLQPSAARGFFTFIDWCSEQVEKRRQMKLERPDITSWLLDDFNNNQQSSEALKWLHGDARLIVVAGADTTATTLTFLFFHLAADPTLVEKLREEIEQIWNQKTEFSVWDFQNARYLNGVINEALRLYPPVPSGVMRLTPPEGVTIDDAFVPGGVNISVPNWAIGRCKTHTPFLPFDLPAYVPLIAPNHYAQPDAFIPERWSIQPDLIKSRNAFAPFSLGPFGCIGKNLALMELRTVICLLVSKNWCPFLPFRYIVTIASLSFEDLCDAD